MSRRIFAKVASHRAPASRVPYMHLRSLPTTLLPNPNSPGSLAWRLRLGRALKQPFAHIWELQLGCMAAARSLPRPPAHDNPFRFQRRCRRIKGSVRPASGIHFPGNIAPSAVGPLWGLFVAMDPPAADYNVLRLLERTVQCYAFKSLTA